MKYSDSNFFPNTKKVTIYFT